MKDIMKKIVAISLAAGFCFTSIPSSAMMTTLAEEPQAVEEESQVEAPATSTFFEYEDDYIYACATLDPADALPEGTTLTVKHLLETSYEQAELDLYYWTDQVLKDTLNSQDMVPVDSNIYDLYFMKDGARLPISMPFKVNITYKQPAFLHEDANWENVRAYHLEDNYATGLVETTDLNAIVNVDPYGAVTYAEFYINNYNYSPFAISMVETKAAYEQRLAAEAPTEEVTEAPTEGETESESAPAEETASLITDESPAAEKEETSAEETSETEETESSVEESSEAEEEGTPADDTHEGNNEGVPSGDDQKEEITEPEADGQQPADETDKTDGSDEKDDELTEEESSRYIIYMDETSSEEETTAEKNLITQEAETEEESTTAAEDETTAAEEETEEETTTASEDEKESEEEMTAEEETKEAAPEEKPATRSYYASWGGDVSATIILSNPEQVPDTAEVVVTPVTPESGDYNYAAYMEALNSSDASVDYTPENTLLYDISFVDTIIGEDGTEQLVVYEPAAGTVQVILQFRRNQLSEEINAESSENVTVNHLVTDAAVDSAAVTSDEIAVQPVDANVKLEGTDKVEFFTDSFSVYAFTYTVDFEYAIDGEVFQYSIDGGESISLSALTDILGILNGTAFESVEAFLKEVAGVAFTDTTLVSVTKDAEGDDWTLQSLKAFDTEEALTITMKNGDVVTVKVTDARDGYEDLKESSTMSFDMSVVDKEESTAVYNAGSKLYEMQLNLSFQIPSNEITGNNKTKYALELSTGLTIPQEFLNRENSAYDSVTGAESFKYKVVEEGGKYLLLVEYTATYIQSIKDESRMIGKNSLTLDIAVGSEWLQSDGSLKGHVLDGTEVSVSPDKITYPEGTDGRHDLSVKKSFGGYDKTTNKMRYTMIVTSSLGTEGPITINDVLTVTGGNELTVSDLTVTSVKTGTGNEYYLDNVTTPVTGYTAVPAADKKGVTITLPQAAPPANADQKTVYLVEYEYTLSGVTDDFESSGKNTATATSGNITVDDEAGWNISQAGIALNKSGQYNAEDGTITWTIQVTNNKDTAIPLQDDAFKGLSFSALTITPAGASASDFNSTTGTLTIDAGKSYTITYQTTPTVADSTKASQVTNKAVAGEAGPGQKSVEPGVTVPAEASVSKELVAASRNGDNAVLTWRVKIHVPANGFAEGTTFTEQLKFNQDWNSYDDMAYFTEAQKDALVNAIKAYFGDAIEVQEYVPSGKVTDEYNNTTRTAAKLVMKFQSAWPGANQTSEYLGKDITIEYQTSANLADLSSDNNGYDNSFQLNDLTPATATHSFKEHVVKMADPGNAADVTNATADADHNKLHWYVQVALEDDANSITVTDTLPQGLTVTAIRMGDGFYNLVGLVQTSETSWAGETETDWRNGVPAWASTYLSDSTPSAVVNGQTLTISLTSDHVPEYFKTNDTFYFYIEAQIDESEFPATGSADRTFANNASVTVDGNPYGSDDQTQNVTLKTSVLDKSGDSSVWNAQNGAHELSYTIDINPNGGQIAGSDGQITLVDHVEYYKTVKDNQGQSHNVSMNLKEGSAKLQRKDSNGQWVDIPATEGWGYILNENATSPSDNIKAKEIEVFGIPDETALRFVYIYNVEVEGLAKNATVSLGAIKNTATIHAVVEESSSHTESKDWKNIQSSGSTESTGSLTIVKVQDGNYAIALPDTYFVLEQFVPAASGVDSEGTWEAISAIGSTVKDEETYTGDFYVYKTNSYGKLSIAADPMNLGKEGNFQYDTLYRVREYKPHEGYTLDGLNPEAVYFYFGYTVTVENRETTLKGYHYNGGSTHADDLLREADTVYMTNQRVTDTISVRKQWNATTLWPEEVAQVTMELQKNGETVEKPSAYTEEHNGKYYTSDDTSFSSPWENPIVLTSDHPEAAWEKLDIDTAADNPFDGYRIVETGIRYMDSGTAKDLTMVSEGADQYQWKIGADGEVLFETFGGKVTNGMGTIVNMSKTKLDVTKSWGTQQLGSDSGIQVVMTLVKEERLYARNGVIESPLANWQADFAPVEGAVPIVLDGATDDIETAGWTAAFDNLDRFRYDESNGRLYEIRYSVQETVTENGRDVTDRYLSQITYNRTGDKVTVTNSPNVGKLVVHKVWQRRTPGEGETLPALPEAVYVSLERYYVDDEGTQHTDTVFNADHRGIRITEADTWQKDSYNTYTWAMLFENLQRQVEVDGRTYDYKYVVKEDNVNGFTKVITGDDIRLSSGATGQVNEVTVTNVENETIYEPQYIDIHLEKLFTDQEGEPQLLPDGAEASIRLYRYVTIERGTYDLLTKELTPTETSRRAEDTEFNSSANDAAWTHVLSVANHTTTGTANNYSWFEDSWSNLPISEIYYNNGTYTKSTYEYYLVEKSATDASHHAYTAIYMKDGSQSEPITIGSEGSNPANGNPIKEAEIWNIETDKTLTIRKYWFNLDADSMPGIVVKLQRCKDQNFNSNVEDVSAFATSDNGSTANGSKTFTFVNDNQESTFQGYLLNQDNNWNLSFSGLEGNGYWYRVEEVGYYTKRSTGSGESYVVLPFDGDQFYLNNRYYYSTNNNEVLDLSHSLLSDMQSKFNNNNNRTSNNYGTFSIANVPKAMSFQLHLQKTWYSFTGHTGFSNMTADYDGKGSGSTKAKILMQIYQRPYWVYGEHAGEYASDWVELNDPIEIAYNEGPRVNVQVNGQTWRWTIEGNTGMPTYGYKMNEDGIYELVYYDYKWLEVGMKPGSDGRTFRTYYDGYPNEPEKHSDDPTYYVRYHDQLVENYETGLLKLIKDWKATSNYDNTRVFLTVVDDTGKDIAKEVYESDNKEYYGVTADQVAYISQLGKYVFVLDSGDKVSKTRWELLIRGLDVVHEVDPATHTGYGEVTYTVEEVGVEVEDVKNGETEKVVYAVGDSNYPFSTSYYRRVRFNGEQFVGSTADGEAGQTLSAGGLQLDSALAYTQDDKSLTWARVVNSDEPTTELTIQKKWPGDLYPSNSMKVVLSLQQRKQKTDEDNQPLWEADGTTPQWDGGWEAAEGTTRGTITLPLAGYSGENAWTYTWKNLPIHKTISNSGTENEQYEILWYRVIETSSPDWTSSTLVSVNADGETVPIGEDGGSTGDKLHPITQVLTNHIDNTDIHIEKQWTNLYASADEKADTWTAEDPVIQWPEGYAIDYKVVRHAWVVSAYEASGTVNYTRGFEVQDLKQDPLMTGQLSASNPSYDLTNQPKGTILSTGDNPPTGLSKNTTYVIEYEYEIIETAITTPNGKQSVNLAVTPDDRDDTGEYIREDGDIQGTATITNDLTSIEVQKVWGDTYDHANDTVTVQLYSSSQRPEGVVPVGNGTITILVDPLDTKGRTDMDQGQITVTVTGDNGFSKDYVITHPDWSVTTEELPENAAETGNLINYTVTVKSVDGNVIESATVTGEDTVHVGDTVKLEASAVEPPASFVLKFNPNWVIEDIWQDGAPAPTDPSAFANLTLSYNGNTETIRLDPSNEWGKTLNKTLRIANDDGSIINYLIRYDDNNSNKNGSFIRRIENINPNSFTGDNAVDGVVSVAYKGVALQKQQDPQPSGNPSLTINYGQWSCGHVLTDYNNHPVTSGSSVVITVYSKVKPNARYWSTNQGNYDNNSHDLVVSELYQKGEYTYYQIVKDNITSEITVGINFQHYQDTNLPAQISNVVIQSPSTVSLLPIRRMTAPNPTSSTQAATVAGSGDKTPIDAVPVGDPITLSDGNWSHLWENLPTTDENGNPIYYYVRETGYSVDPSTTSIVTTYEYTKHDDEDARKGYAIVTVTNTTEREEPEYGSVKVTKNFSGINDNQIPANFKITASWGSTSVDLKVTGTTPANVTRIGSFPNYTWEISGLDLGTAVSFTETGYDVTGYNVEINGKATAETKTTTAVIENPTAVTFENKYTEKLGALKLTKNLTINGKTESTATWALTNGTYKFEIKGVPGTPTKDYSQTVEITFENGKATGYKIGNTSYTATDSGNYTYAVTVKDLVPGNYTIKETNSGNLTLSAVLGGTRYSLTDKTVTVTVTADDTTAAEAEAQATFTNNKDTTEYEFTKKWQLNGEEEDWPKDIKAIEVTLTRTADGVDTPQSATFTVTSSAITKETGATITDAFTAAKVDGDGYSYKITDLDKYYIDSTGAKKEWTYSIQETAILDTDDKEVTTFYEAPKYLKAGAAEDEEDEEIAATAVKPSGVTIVNNKSAAALPVTGGIGTTIFTILGALLISSGVFLLIRNQRRRRKEHN